MAFADCLDDPLQQEVYAYWRAKRAGRTMPRRRDIDPADIPRLLPNLLISEIVESNGGVRYRYRLAGSAIVAAFGKNPTGCYADEITTGAYGDFVIGLHRLICEKRRPVFCESEYTGFEETNIRAKRLLLPLSENDAAVNQVLSLLVFRHGSRRAAVLELDSPEVSARHAAPVLADNC